MTKKELYDIAEKVGFIEYIKAAEEFERQDCENICKSFAMKERRIEVAAALNRAADLIRLRSANIDNEVTLPDTNTPVDFIKYV